MGAVVTVLVVAAACAFPALAVAESTDAEGAGLSSFAPAPTGPRTPWTRSALEAAEPLPVVTLPGSPPGGARTAALGAKSAGVANAFAGTEVGAAESALFPNDANGKLFGEFRIPLNSQEIQIKKYMCSASVVPSRRGNVILTAAHCVIDPATGTVATEHSVVFIPGYRNGVAPYGAWEAVSYKSTESWEKAARGGPQPNEGGDLALLTLEANKESENVHEGENVEKVVGWLGIAFDQACDQTYTQYGYPAESPYPDEGPVLYSYTAAYAGTDSNSAILPRPIKIASDFTRGASGGPWTIGSSSSPTALSVTAYGYENQPGYLYGPYFGEAARKVYERAASKGVPFGIEETCKALPESPTPEPTPTPAPSPTPPAPEATPATISVSLKVTRVRRRADGSAVLTAQVSSAGTLKLSGAAVRAESVNAPAAGKYRLVVSPKGVTNRRLRKKGRAKVGVKVAFRASGKTRRVSRAIQLSRRPSARHAQPQG